MFLAAAAPATVAPWINLHALWQIVLLGLVAGAGLPALFALGLRALALPGGSARPADASSDRLVGGSPAGLIAAGLCFLIVLAAIAWCIYAIYESGH
jgi:hypothetical protein